MIRPNRTYQFVSAASIAPKVTDFSNAQTLTDIDSILSGNERIGKYEFEENSDLDTKCKALAESVEIALKTLDSGAVVNDSVLVKKDGKRISIRLFGTEKKAVNPQTLDKNALKSKKFGFCVSDGERVCNAGMDATGKATKIPVIYLHL